MKYSQHQLEIIRNSIKEALKEKLNKHERYCYLSNLSLVNSEIEKLEPDLPDNDPKYQEYVNKSVKLSVEYGATSEKRGDLIIITDFSTIEDTDKYEKEQEKLNKEYAEAIKRQTEINNEIKEKKSQEIAEIEWKTVDFDKVDSDSDKVINENTFHFIKEPT